MTGRFILRRTTSLVLRSSLPGKTTSYVFCGLSGTQRRLYGRVGLLRREREEYPGSEGERGLTWRRGGAGTGARAAAGVCGAGAVWGDGG